MSIHKTDPKHISDCQQFYAPSRTLCSSVDTDHQNPPHQIGNHQPVSLFILRTLQLELPSFVTLPYSNSTNLQVKPKNCFVFKVIFSSFSEGNWHFTSLNIINSIGITLLLCYTLLKKNNYELMVLDSITNF